MPLKFDQPETLLVEHEVKKMEKLVISTTLIERIVDAAPWVIYIVLVPAVAYAAYVSWKMLLGSIERWSVFRAKLASEKKTRLDLLYGKYIEDEIQKVFESIPLRKGGYGTSGYFHNEKIHAECLIAILKACDKHAKLEEYVIYSTSVPVHSKLKELIEELESGVERETNKKSDS